MPDHILRVSPREQPSCIRHCYADLVPHESDGDQLPNPLPLTYVVCLACHCETAVVAYRHLDEQGCFCPECEFVWDELAGDS